MGYFVATFLFLIEICVAYSIAWGRDRRLVHSREYCYRNLNLPPLSDSEFCNHELFKTHAVPQDYVIKKRHSLCEDYLDYPPDRLYPEMAWNEIPLDASPWERDLDGLYMNILALGVNPREFLKDKTVAQVICDLFVLETKQ